MYVFKNKFIKKGNSLQTKGCNYYFYPREDDLLVNKA